MVDMPSNNVYLIYMYKEDFALNELQRLLYHKVQPNQIKLYIFNIYI